ncbi:unnamed protein product [Urochloa decumbens]|uniref:Leucine-rich repeat-containing N-terminal plant-type domain-containing protein n=1 Tax=Urochloa decumbens TaxID=240449 RepID=A0ABC9BGB4_9POAL
MLRYHRHGSYLLLFLATTMLATSGRGVCQCRQDQSAALLHLKGSFRFHTSVSESYDDPCSSFPLKEQDLSSWKVDTNCCTWEGVTCDGASGYVTSLDLSRLCISGNLSSPDILKLTSLRFLSLAYNNFSESPWPSPGFERLTDLKYLNLSYSGLSGDVPVKNGQLSNLVTLDLSGLDLKDLNFETLIDSLGRLQKLNLDGATFSFSPTDSALASSTNTTSGLKELSMQRCVITGGRFDTILTKLPFLTNLVLVAPSVLDVTNLTLDALIVNLRSLQKLYLGVCIPLSPTRSVHASSVNTTPGLKELIMKNCGLAGTFPSWIFRIKSLKTLDVSENYNLYGELPEFKHDSALKVLNLSNTNFSGKIPESVSNLQNLTILDLSNCQFHGPVPPFTHQWPKIRVVDLSNNNLNGSLPSHGYLPLHSLNILILRNNSICGEIPASLFSHPSLASLDLSQNNFTGYFLLYPNASLNFKMIDLSNNKLQGQIPDLLSNLVGLQELDLSSNKLTGIVNLGFIKNYKNLSDLSLSNNKLSVVEEDDHSYLDYPINIMTLELSSCNLTNVPRLLMHQKECSKLDLSNNNIGGHIPDWIWGTGWGSLNLSHNSFTSIQTNLSNTLIDELDIHSNKIEGAVPLPPQWINRLDYSNNNFSSIMPEFWSSITFAEYLSLAKNNLIGEISHLICNVTFLQVLDLAFNGFSGLIPPCLLKDTNGIEILNLRGNNFHGSLPPDISKECTLEIIDLNGNMLEGKLPVSMVNCHLLQVLDIGDNMIVDMFPEWLGTLPLLKVLVLRSNSFHGHIDHYGMSKQMNPFFPALQVLDLSSNSFNGSIPPGFLKKFKAMTVVSSSGAPGTNLGIIGPFSAPAPGPSLVNPIPNYQNSVTITLKEHETTLVQIFSVFTSLDLSNNNLVGIIPDEIGDLKSLKGLNLSRNSFTGGIPHRIANMLQLESLDVSYNQLSGEIPPAMALMSFLGMLNLSYNHLSGMIPQSSQFLTFPNTSFLGNDGLCGKPLTRPCEPNQAPSAAPTLCSSKDLNWEILSVEVGIISGLAVVVVTTLLWGNGRRWVYWHVDKFWLKVLQ